MALSPAQIRRAINALRSIEHNLESAQGNFMTLETEASDAAAELEVDVPPELEAAGDAIQAAVDAVELAHAVGNTLAETLGIDIPPEGAGLIRPLTGGGK